MLSLPSCLLNAPPANHLFLHLKPPKPPNRLFHPLPPFKHRPGLRFTIPNSERPLSNPIISNSLNELPPRTLFPGGYKRPEIKVPNLVLQLSSQEVLDGKNSVLDAVDRAVANRVGIVVLSGAGASGAKLYESACLLKSVIRDRSYLLIDERVDIAAAVDANGVLLSDEGIPAIVARNMMINSKSGSVVLPLVARTVHSINAALDASKIEGADFLIYNSNGDIHPEEEESSVFEQVKVPTFITISSIGNEKSYDKISYLLKSGASGLVLSLDRLELFRVDDLNKLYDIEPFIYKIKNQEIQGSREARILEAGNGTPERSSVDALSKLEERVLQLIETEKSLLYEAICFIERAAPLMEEVSLLSDAVSQLDDPFLLVIVGEFNSGKSTVINAILGQRYLMDGVVPTTNEITFLRYSETGANEVQHCERHPDGQYVCYLPAPILKDMIFVDTPGTNVILQRQQRLTEEFVPRADLVLFVLSADRPLTESEVAFLRYIQKWKKKVVFVLNKADIYQNVTELEEAVSFVKENASKLLNAETVTLYPVSARSALEAKISTSTIVDNNYANKLLVDSEWRISSFIELEKYLYSYLDSSTITGIERIKLKLGTPVGIAEQLLSACQKLTSEEFNEAKKDLLMMNELLGGIEKYAWKMKSDSISWQRKLLSLISTTQERLNKLVESTLRLSNVDVATSYVLKGEKSTSMPAMPKVQYDIIQPAVSEATHLIEEYTTWLQSSNAREGKAYKEIFAKKWLSLVDSLGQTQTEPEKPRNSSIQVLSDFSAAAASKLFEQEIREVFVGSIGGLGAAGLSASLLTSVLPTTLEDLLALGLCSAGGYFAVSKFPARRAEVVNKVRRTADALASEMEGAMQKDVMETIDSFDKYVKLVGKPYQDVMQSRLDKLSDTLHELSEIQNKVKTLQREIQNLHVFK